MNSAKPWLYRHPDAAEPLATFAVIADSHMNPEDDSCSSPWEVNRLANARTRAVVEELNGVGPDFVVHLGDMIHPVPSQASYPDAAENFRRIFERLQMPFHVVAGNHDVGDKPLEWTPAAVVTEKYVALYEDHFGPSYYSFERAGCTFVVVNAQLFNSGFRSEQQQSQWLERQLAAADRSFLFLHYPPFVLDPEEPGHYDNLDEPARSWFLDLVDRHKVEAVFSGHVHNFFYDRVADTDFYILPSVSFVRSDYSEFARVRPGDDAHGRNDIGKLGYFLVDIYADDHKPRIQRTYGHVASIAKGEVVRQLMPTACRDAGATNVGVDLRHAWAETVEIPYTGGVDEFARKRARNDYPLMALWELGISRLRVPLEDLRDVDTLQRMRVLARNGHRFRPFLLGLPSGVDRDLIRDEAHLLEGLEVILPDATGEDLDRLADLRTELPVPLTLSCLRSRTDDGSGQYRHVINHGYLLGELQEVCAGPARDAADELVVRVGRDQDAYDALRTISVELGGCKLRGVAHVRLAGEVPAEALDDELQAAARVADALVASLAFPDVAVFVDSFLDQDRGYFPRSGLLDRRFNLRLAGHVFRNLNVALPPAPRVTRVRSAEDDGCYLLDGGGVTQLLLVPTHEHKLQRAPAGHLADGPTSGLCRVIDLASGAAAYQTWRRAGPNIELEWPVPLAAPTLIELTTDAIPDGRRGESDGES